MRKCKIIATVGPACEDLQTLRQMIRAGVNVCRLNFSFGTPEEHKKMVASIRAAAAAEKKPVAILQDLQGPKIRIGKLKAPVTVKRGQSIILSGNKTHPDEFYFPTTYEQIASDTKTGKTILIADGKIMLKVISTKKEKKEVLCKVINGGTILTGKGINLPYTNVSLPALTPKDLKDAIFGAKLGVDFMGLSFVRKQEDVLRLRKTLKEHNADIPIIAKIEKPEAMENLDKILDVVDGVMVARGDLAVELSFAKVPVAQKEIIHKAHAKGKITITATEMLSSMIENPVPTRAEVSDVANAVWDGTDALMLSNETAMGKNPMLAVKTMSDVITEAEKANLEYCVKITNLDLPAIHKTAEAVAKCASNLSYDMNEKLLAVFTYTGDTPRILSKFRPDHPILAISSDVRICNRMALYHNVQSLLLNGSNKKFKYDENDLERVLLSEKRVKPGDKVICLLGNVMPSGVGLDTIKLHIVKGKKK